MAPDELTQERIARNDARFREANERIETAAESLGFSHVPFVCECANTRCREIIRMPLHAYEEVRSDGTQFLVVPWHETAAQDAAEVVSKRDGYHIVRKTGRAAEVAAQLDGRAADGPEATGGEGERHG